MNSQSRRRGREVALQFLYNLDIEFQTQNIPLPLGLDLVQSLSSHFEHFHVDESTREFVSRLVINTIQHLASIDKIIVAHAQNWKLERMSFIDRNLLRMAVSELAMASVDAPRNVVIDEAVEIAKTFGTEDSSSFINGVLDAVESPVVLN